MSALESIINQRIKEFESSKPGLVDLRNQLTSLQQQLEVCPDDDAARQRINEQIKEKKRELQAAEAPTQEEIDYIMQVGYLLHKMENEEDDYGNPTKSEKTFFGCSVTVERQKGLAYKKYMAEIEKDKEFQEKLTLEALQNKRPDICKHCGGGLVESRECTYCKECGMVDEMVLWDTADVKNNITYEQQVNDVVTVYSYNRINHLNEWLSKLQAREMTNIPAEVMDALRLELKKARITNPSDITQKKVKELLKKLKLSKYYEHVPNITNMLTGAEVPKFPPHLEDKLRCMFEQIQKPFQMFCPKNRKNFLHYGYVLYKFCELLGEDQWLPYIPMLKSFEKVYAQDQIFKQICAHLRWEFIPSV